MMRRTLAILTGMLLTLLASAATVKYTVISRTAVEASGTEPEECRVVYYQSGSGQKGQMTAGSYTQLTIYTEQDLIINGLTLEMRSNTSSGGGSLDIFADKRHDFNLPTNYFNAETWAGTYTTTFVPLDFFFEEPIVAHDSLRIIIAAFENSIYVRSYTLTYNMGPKRRYSVALDPHNGEQPRRLHEHEAGAGIVLPKLADLDGWYFYGWSLKELWTQTTYRPEIHMAGETYYPHEDVLLHAVYTNAKSAFWMQTLEPTSGLYLLAASRDSCMATGKINSQKKLSTTRWIPTMTADSLYICTLRDVPENAVYEINILPDSCAYLSHYATSTMIASRKNTLAKDSTAWRYRKLTDNSFAFYVPADGTYAYALLPSYGTSVSTFDSLWISCDSYNLHNIKHKGLILFNLADQPQEGETLYTSNPVASALSTVEMQHYELTDGELLNVNREEWMLYTSTGQLITTTNGNISTRELPHGIYILQTNKNKHKIRL